MTDDGVTRCVPEHLAVDYSLVSERPIRRRRVRLRNIALRRLTRWWLNEDRHAYAADMLRLHRTALKAAVVGGASYRASRRLQDVEENGRRIGRGRAWT